MLSPNNVKPQMCMYQKVVLSTTYTTLLSTRKKYSLRPFVVSFFLLYRNRNLAVVSVHVFLEVP